MFPNGSKYFLFTMIVYTILHFPLIFWFAFKNEAKYDIQKNYLETFISWNLKPIFLTTRNKQQQQQQIAFFLYKTFKPDFCILLGCLASADFVHQRSSHMLVLQSKCHGQCSNTATIFNQGYDFK